MLLPRTGMAAVLAALPLGMVLAAPETGAVDRAREPTASRGTVMNVPPFARYEIILARKPFGSPPPVAAEPAPVDNAAAQQAQEEQKLARQINMVAVNKTPSGKTAVGFIDKSAKPERNYYLAVGETPHGYTVVDASYEEETATLRKDEVTITLKLGQGLVKGGPTAPVSVGPSVPAAGRAAPAPNLAPPGRPTVPGTLTSESFRQRLARQRAEREAAEAARQKRAVLDAEARAEKITKEELEKATREINLNLVRQGMKPISPITLTPEEDAEMVRLGVFETQ